LRRQRLGVGSEEAVMTSTIRRILCPIDFSETSFRALDHATDLARRRDADLTVLHVAARTMPPLSALAAGTGDAIEGGVRDQVRHDLLEELQRACAQATTGVRVVYEVDEGHVAGLIAERAARADLVVLGTHGHGVVEDLVLGSVAERVLHKSPCPVLAVPPASERPRDSGFQHILCALDLSPTSDAVLAHAVALAREGGGQVAVLHVVEVWQGVASSDIHLEVGGYLRREEEEARKRLLRLQTAADASLVDGEALVVKGRAGKEIVRVAKEREFDLIVMGVEGRDAVGRFFFGSTARHVVRHASCPVLAVRGLKRREVARAGDVAGALAEPVGSGRSNI
jgi:nucleotide-binding universal stress UspA family protein